VSKDTRWPMDPWVIEALTRDDIDDVLAIEGRRSPIPGHGRCISRSSNPAVSYCSRAGREPPGGRFLLVLARAGRAAHQQPGGAARLRRTGIGSRLLGSP
jgi:hypothetical protein